MKKLFIAVFAYIVVIALSVLVQVVMKVPNLLFYIVLVATFVLFTYITRYVTKAKNAVK
ncbi:hypothetical protein KTT66_10035 [Lacticaseibacillus casei]|uniref:Uncharacterized protein n=1 Tax=Lacticaseibacillus huelsenbergensis TaxID=3035291 RepID=A0ABY8DSN9_9LACO|nr:MULTISPECIES: hypothetical protein [Lacticaseibacillus]MDG3062098.1 hypothetical protein [Lacticaseibacillus sp. BCRC 81376]QVI36734.1 hypothetical protein KGS74_10825 [Lacticaseibacillus casei]QXG58525.1 hypothetical protein KTT66_10035 [Lacticaseibacillus casei]WFB40003.1 hypothetical protein LHUE1_000773 [Lacticaseibacillus huelsenbergensis]WFB41735.1 hypothetical protein LHUE2_002597 [Lacticaseibacillus huelsenbergensis]